MKTNPKQQEFSFAKTHWQHRFSHGGILRNLRKGRGARPLSRQDPLHLVIKANKECIKGGLRQHLRYELIHNVIRKYAKKFFVKVEQISVQGDHIHLLIRSRKRTNFQSFFKVVSGQISQRFQKKGLVNFAIAQTGVTTTPKTQERAVKLITKLWRYRPFSRVVKGWKSYKTVRNYIQLNEQEALGKIVYRKSRLKGLSTSEWEVLWV